jgi:uracil-DNA glycosylase
VRRLLPILVGEAPSRDTEGLPPFSGRSGACLEELLGRPLRERFVVVNVLGRWPGRQGSEKGSAFPRLEAARGALRLAEEYAASSRRWVFCGWRVRDAFAAALGVHWTSQRYLRWEWLRDHDGMFGVETYAVLPHPSGVNLWWNDPANVERARRFLREAARCAE